MTGRVALLWLNQKVYPLHLSLCIVIPDPFRWENGGSYTFTLFLLSDWSWSCG